MKGFFWWPLYPSLDITVQSLVISQEVILLAAFDSTKTTFIESKTFRKQLTFFIKNAKFISDSPEKITKMCAVLQQIGRGVEINLKFVDITGQENWK